jgi:hypothetical protein
MDHGVDTAQGIRHRVTVAHIAEEELDLGQNTGRVGTFTVDLFNQAVEDANPMAAVQQFGAHKAANETGAAGY